MRLFGLVNLCLKKQLHCVLFLVLHLFIAIAFAIACSSSSPLLLFAPYLALFLTLCFFYLLQWVAPHFVLLLMMVCRPSPCAIICVVHHFSPCVVVACCDVSHLPCVITCCGSFPSPCAIFACYGESPSPCVIVACCGSSLLALCCYFIVPHLFQVFNSPFHLTLFVLLLLVVVHCSLPCATTICLSR